MDGHRKNLANQIGVSRQAVSKWESAASVPDLNKIIKMSEVFDVSTDYLLKDAIEKIELNDEMGDFPESKSSWYAEEPIRSISMEEANCYLEMVKMTAGKIAFGVLLCILSPVLLILLGGLSDAEGGYI